MLLLAKPAPLSSSPSSRINDALTSDMVASQEQQAKDKEALLLYCFPEVHHHPHQATIEAQSHAWLADLYQGCLPAERVEGLLDTRLDTLGCVFYPHGSSDARSLTLNKLIHWLFVLDDVLDDPHLLGHNYEAARCFACRHFRAMFGSDMTAMIAVGLATGDHEDDEAEPTVNNNSIINVATGSDQEPHHDIASALARAQQDLVIEVGVQWAEEMRFLGLSSRQLERLREAVAAYLAGIVGIVRLRQE